MGTEGETSQLSDMIAIALRLSEGGVGDYWDDADRWSRNHLAEAQLTKIDWIGRLPQDLAVQPHSTRSGYLREISALSPVVRIPMTGIRARTVMARSLLCG